jgi:hypothetical protein
MKEYLNEVCKIGQGHACCRYIVAGADGITCAKLTYLKDTIDARVAAETFTARGDNCEGQAETVDLTTLTKPS